MKICSGLYRLFISDIIFSFSTFDQPASYRLRKTTALNFRCYTQPAEPAKALDDRLSIPPRGQQDSEVLRDFVIVNYEPLNIAPSSIAAALRESSLLSSTMDPPSILHHASTYHSCCFLIICDADVRSHSFGAAPEAPGSSRRKGRSCPQPRARGGSVHAACAQRNPEDQCHRRADKYSAQAFHDLMLDGKPPSDGGDAMAVDNDTTVDSLAWFTVVVSRSSGYSILRS